MNSCVHGNERFPGLFHSESTFTRVRFYTLAVIRYNNVDGNMALER